MNLSIKNVPEDVVQRLRERAAASHCSLQGELMHIIEVASLEHPRRDDPRAMLEYARSLGFESPGRSADWIREDRDR